MCSFIVGVGCPHFAVAVAAQLQLDTWLSSLKTPEAELPCPLESENPRPNHCNSILEVLDISHAPQAQLYPQPWDELLELGLRAASPFVLYDPALGAGDYLSFIGGGGQGSVYGATVNLPNVGPKKVAMKLRKGAKKSAWVSKGFVASGSSTHKEGQVAVLAWGWPTRQGKQSARE